jgi:hypothetical protein
MGPLGRAVIAGLLAAAGVVFGISMEDLTYQGHRSTSIGTTSTAEPTTNVKRAPQWALWPQSGIGPLTAVRGGSHIGGTGSSGR